LIANIDLDGGWGATGVGKSLHTVSEKSTFTKQIENVIGHDGDWRLENVRKEAVEGKIRNSIKEK